MTTAIFHGTALPDRGWAQDVTADVVLQPFHPIVQTEAFAEWFPRAQRFVYVNPTAVDRVRCSEVTDEMIMHDARDPWALPRLRVPKFLEWAVADAIGIGRGKGIDGVFIDDLDRLIGAAGLDDVAIEFVDRVVEATSCRIYVNRAFGILDRLACLDAVLVEALDLDLEQPGVNAWLDEFVLPPLKRAFARGVRIHRIEYEAEPSAHRAAAGSAHRTMKTSRSELSVDLVTTSKCRQPSKLLDCWTAWLDIRQCE